MFWFHSVLNSSTNNEGKKGRKKKKPGANVSLYTVPYISISKQEQHLIVESMQNKLMLIHVLIAIWIFRFECVVHDFFFKELIYMWIIYRFLINFREITNSWLSRTTVIILQKKCVKYSIVLHTNLFQQIF